MTPEEARELLSNFLQGDDEKTQEEGWVHMRVQMHLICGPLSAEAAACRLDEDPTKRDAIVAAMLEEAEERWSELQLEQLTEQQLWGEVAKFEAP